MRKYLRLPFVFFIVVSSPASPSAPPDLRSPSLEHAVRPTA